MTGEFVRIIAAFIGVIGFSIFFNLKKERLLYAAVLGTFSGTIYIFCEKWFPENVSLYNMIPALIGTFLSELSARWKKAPAVIFILPSIIILIPGGSFYYTMSYLVNGNQELFQEWGSRTLLAALGIAVGIIVASFVFYEIIHMIQATKERSRKKFETYG